MCVRDWIRAREFVCACLEHDLDVCIFWSHVRILVQYYLKDKKKDPGPAVGRLQQPELDTTQLSFHHV